MRLSVIRKWLPALVGALTLAIFWPVTHANFLPWDDDILITRNPHLTGISADSLRWMFVDYTYTARYQPLAWLTWFGLYDLAGINPRVYHAANLVFHTLSAVMVYLLLGELVRRSAKMPLTERQQGILAISATLGALLWALHPLRVEAVAWVAVLVHCQGIFLLLLAIWLYLRYNDHELAPTRRRLIYLGSLAAFTASMLTFPVGVGMVVMLLVLDVFALARLRGGIREWFAAGNRPVLWEKLPYAALTLVVLSVGVLIRYQNADRWGATVGVADFGVAQRLAQAAYVWIYMLWKTWTPFHLTPVYTDLLAVNPLASPFLFSQAALVLITAVLVWKRKHWPLGLALWIFHLAVVFPMCGWTENPHFPSDRYSLMSGLVWSVLLTAGLWRLHAHPQRWRLAAAVAGGLLAVCAMLSIGQIPMWRHSVPFFSRLIRLNDGEKYKNLHYYHLGAGYRQLGDERQAELAFRQSLARQPNYFWAWFQLGLAEAAQGKYATATTSLRKAAGLRPKSATVRNRLAEALIRLNQLPEAAEQYQQSLIFSPQDAGVHQALADILEKLDRTEEAKHHRQEAARLRGRQP